MTDVRQLLLNPRKRLKLDNDRTACTSAEEDDRSSHYVQRPNIAEVSGLAAAFDDDDLLQDVIERQQYGVHSSKSILKHFYH